MSIVNKLISLPYQLAHQVRKISYGLGIFQAYKLPVPVISVGNLSFGGTGKTPIVIYLAEYFASHGYKVLVLNRSYKSSNKNFENIVLNSRDSNDASIKPLITVENIGDEAMEMLLRFMYDGFDITLGLGKDRYENALEAIEKHDCNLCILDDGQQHLALNQDLKIILKNAGEKGFYREFDNKDYDFEIFTKVNPIWLQTNKHRQAAAFELQLTKNIDKTREIGVFTGIADPETFLTILRRHMEDKNLTKNQKFRKFFFPDHHAFTIDEVTRVISLGINLITTPKDIVKIPENLRSNFSVAVPKVKFHPAHFPQLLLQKLNEISLVKN